MNLARIVTLFVLFIQATLLSAQCGSVGSYCQDGASYATCTGVVYDANGVGSYAGGGIITICPEVPGLATSLDFLEFSLAENINQNNSDLMIVYDGPDATQPVLGNFYGNELSGLTIKATANNPSGCLTLVLIDRGLANNAETSPASGFIANISCGTPCSSPTSFIETVDPSVVAQGESITGCVGQPITFTAEGSSAEAGFTVSEYIWNFGEGSTAPVTSPQAQHTFQEPGLYFVTATVVDNNGCPSLNNLPIQVLVSTIPVFTDIAAINPSYCLGTNVVLNAGTVEYPTWSSIPPVVFSETISLPDIENNGPPVPYINELNFTFFDEGSVVENCEDIVSIQTALEHSWVNDLSIEITCPNGTTVEMLPQPNGMGNVYFGEPIFDDVPPQLGIPYDYFWTSNPADPLMVDIATLNASIPAGNYQSEGDLCALVGCPLNGIWQITLTDNIAIDNGWLTTWTINFAPELYPEVTTFTPTYGGGADSSFWSGPNITFLDAGADVIELNLTEPGTYEYTYETSNNFGCSSDTTISITIQEPPTLFAGEDFDYQCQEVDLVATLNGQQQPTCSGASEVVTYCYPNNTTYVETYCPDNPGDGITFMSLTFTQGTIEFFSDDLTIYDGQNTGAAVIWNSNTANQTNLSGLEFTATNPSGCITMQLTSDISISCGDGFETEMIYEVSCPAEIEYIFEWSPSAGLSAAEGSTVTIEQLSTTTTYNLTAYPADFPECAIFDEITVSVANNLEISLDEVAQACLDSALVLEAPEIVIGTAPFTYTWTRPDGTTEESETLLIPSVQDVEEYCVTVSDVCNLSTEACIEVQPYTPIPATFQVEENLGCTPFVATMTSDYTVFQNLQSMTWSSGNGQTQNILGSASFIYPIAGIYRPILEIVDVNGCVYIDTLNNAINVLQAPVADFIMDPEDPYLPQTTIRFRDNSSNAATYLYNFSNLGESDEPNTEFTFPDQRGVYFVELVVQNEIGCPDTIRKELIIREDLNIFIPNSFTPDGDGVNDIWRIQGTGFVNQNYELTILNRWGQPVFESTDPNEPWLGDMQSNGYYSQDSLYFYILKIQDIENDVRYEYKGHITLLR